MDSSIATLLAVVTQAKSFEGAATEVLRPILAVAREAMATSAFHREGRILRGMVHIRPDDAYRRLAVLEERGRDEEGPSCAPSTTAWRWVATYGTWVAIDVMLGTIALGLGRDEPMPAAASELFDSQESQVRLLGREATHVLVLPLRAPGGAIEGMISLEADCRAAVGKEFIWPAVAPRMEALAQIGAPYLLALPAQLPTPVTDEFLPIIGASMASTVEVLRIFARQEETVLLSGPTGAGKSRLARWCHEQSPRRGGAFETLDLATVPEDLQMAELFGWKKGAFSGAMGDNAGCITRADRGTLFIDEIDKLSLKAQAGLLRLVEERRYRPLGDGAGDRNANVRTIVGTNVNLHAAVRAGTFREDLYYRINVLPVKVPPLAERSDEIPQWAAFMLARRHRSSVADGDAWLSADADRALVRCEWPGNLRQLDNIVRRAYALALMEQGDAPQRILLEARHVDRALAYEGGEGSTSVIDAFLLASIAFVRDAERRRAAGEPPLDLDLCDAMRGFVLGAAIERASSREDAFRLVGKDAMVQNRNHQKALRRELERVQALCAAFGQKQTPFDKLIDPDDKG